MHHLSPTLPGTRYRSENFLKADPGLHHYALAIHATDYALVVTHKETGEIQLAYRTADNSGKELCKDLLTKEMPFWQEVNLPAIRGQILHTGSRYTLVPDLVNNEEIISSLFALTHDISDNEQLRTVRSENPDITLIYGVEHETESYLRNMLPLATHSHIGASLLQQHNNYGDATTFDTSTAVYSTSQSLVVHVAHKGRTTLLNSFPYRSQNDLMYFLAALAAHPELKGVNGPMWIMGVIDDEDETFIEQMKRFIPHLTYTQHPADSVLPEKEQHCFHLLLHQLSCAS